MMEGKIFSSQPTGIIRYASSIFFGALLAIAQFVYAEIFDGLAIQG